MNAPLPLRVARGADANAYDRVAHATQSELAGRLAQRLASETKGEVLFSAADRGRYATDASIYQVMPVGVFVPRTSDEARAALDICRDLKVPVVARGAGTSQCGQTVGAGLVIDFSKHVRALLEFDSANATAVVEPGIVLDHLNAQLKKSGLWYPVDVSTSAQATLGGMAGNNSCGSRSIAYGNMVHNVLAIEAWTSDGAHHRFESYERCAGGAREIGRRVKDLASLLAPEIDRRWPKVMRRVGGYNLDIFRNQSERPYTGDGGVNLAHLLVGSEGTLALTKNLTLALAPLARAKVLGVVNFPTFYKAMDTAQHIVALGAEDRSLTAVELVDRTMIELALRNPAFESTVRASLIGRPDALLLVEFSGDDRRSLARKLQQLEELMGDRGLPGSVVHLVDDASQKNLWEVRKAGLNIMMSLRGDGKPVSFIEDCAVPLQHLAEYTDALTQVFRRHGTRGTWYAHASVGTLHVRPILDMRKDGARKMRAIAEEASALVRKYKGAYSGEHGDGLCRGEWIAWQFGPKITQAFAEIKKLFDPEGLLAPQRIVEPPRMDDTRLMRFAPSYRVIPLAPALDWSEWDVQNDPATERTTPPGTGGDAAQGFAKAVEMCNNNGHCRKFDAGTMCPSFRVTRDERHVTRGRANTLRLALSGQLGPDGLASDAVREALDLCVSCKGCKRDCPTGVDMARMKVEFLHHDRRKNGFTLRDRLIGQLPAYAATASRFAWLLNLRNRSRLVARMTQALTGLAASRSLPAWRRQHFFNRPLRSATRDEVFAAEKPAVLFVDTFNGFFESETAWAAFRVLRAAGYTVHVAAKDDETSGHLCCGRTYLATGMVEKARARASGLVNALHPFARRGIAIVGLEPSCLLTLRDEALALGLGSNAQEVAKHALLFEEFLAREAAAGRLAPLQARLAPVGAPVLVHGHCHQKAFGAVSPVLDVLKLIPGLQPQLVESSCCGMAGAFGYEASHVEVSMAMAQLSLFPALRAQRGAIVVADGTSCRHQIRDGLGREAVHAAVLLAGQLKGG
ncbi:MAG TPA: FAD-linked oxidase C-terminal domain-containing protein [Ramlibacter sp.]|uniref:FAD-binding and (Fe-S)-binding domain-containing protein n=1 Tax=Ramlibacter sp. TaxID=1917967 RepID=UPI002CD2100F|nr:FAD-linked oxidase C-terminal domain-containing protein [Ramlibacter sp.]HVZ42805.1 FAD-linked oxidase C-terminal domain-containing protein [Ramlibacter sp.]